MTEPWVLEGRSVLVQTPRLLESWVPALSPRLLDAREGPDSFSPREVVAHLVQAERELWAPRLRSMLDHGEARTFPDFDRFAHRAWADARAISDVTREFSMLRGRSLETWDAALADPAILDRRGMHPQFGPVTAAQLFATWVVHDLTHVRQIARVMAKQFSEHVGPWSEYLTVLHETGSAPQPPRIAAD